VSEPIASAEQGSPDDETDVAGAELPTDEDEEASPPPDDDSAMPVEPGG
jgi:hypothetical protein